MPRRRIPRVPLPSEINSNSVEADNSNLNDELPSVELRKTKSTDAKVQKKGSFDFPVDVITKTGKFSGMGTVEMGDARTVTVGKTIKLRKINVDPEVKGNLNNDINNLEEHLQRLEEDMKKSEQDVQRGQPSADDRAKPIAATKAAPVGGTIKKQSAKAPQVEVKAGKKTSNKKQSKTQEEEINKIYKPGECLKYITMEISDSLSSSWYMADTLREMVQLGVSVRQPEEERDEGLVVWTRTVPPRLASREGKVEMCGGKQQCPLSLVIIKSGRALQLVAIPGELARVLAATGARLFVLLNDKHDYMLNFGATRERYSEMLLDLQTELVVSLGLDLVTVHSAGELASLVVHYTRAIAEAPYKKAKRDVDERAEFYMRGDNKNCVTVDKEGNGIGRLWEQMLAVLPNSSLEVARSLAPLYRTPRALVQGFLSPGGMAKVADVGVSRTNIPGGKTRRLGPEFARKLHILFTAEDGNTVIE